MWIRLPDPTVRRVCERRIPFRLLEFVDGGQRTNVLADTIRQDLATRIES
jgi:hypothetical protein